MIRKVPIHCCPKRSHWSSSFVQKLRKSYLVGSSAYPTLRVRKSLALPCYCIPFSVDHDRYRTDARRKERELTESLREQCLISESLNETVEEMQRLILAMTEANDALYANGDQPAADGVENVS